jgi:hypothetical protein
MLLYNIPGPTSFSYLRTVDGVLYATDKEACEALGLLENDAEFDECLTDAAVFKSAHAFRSLFLSIILHSVPTNARALMDRHREAMSDDCEHRLRTMFNIMHPTPEQTWELALLSLQEQAEVMGHSLSDLELETPSGILAIIVNNAQLQGEMNYDRAGLADFYAESMTRANDDQAKAITAITNAVDNGQGGLFYLDGPGGTGKTFVECAILAKLRSEGKVALAVASSGVAALLLPGGRTAHSRFKIPINIDKDSACRVSAQTNLADLFRHADLIVWDEAVMQHQYAFLAVDRMLRDVRKVDEMFGGIVTVFAGKLSLIILTHIWHSAYHVGDLRQCLPVVPHGSRQDTLEASVTRSVFWPQVQKLSLSINMRMNEMGDPERRAFAKHLLEIGDGKVPIVGPGSRITLPESLLLPPGSSQDDLIGRVYSGIEDLDIEQVGAWDAFFRPRSILAPHNATVFDLNAKILRCLPGPDLPPCLSADRASIEDNHPYEINDEYVNEMMPSGFPAHSLELKVGAPVIVLRNLAPSEGLCNGTRMVIMDVRARVIRARILVGAHAGNVVLIPRIRLSAPPDGQVPFTFHRTQFPIRLAFTISINKSQVSHPKSQAHFAGSIPGHRWHRPIEGLLHPRPAVCRVLPGDQPALPARAYSSL